MKLVRQLLSLSFVLLLAGCGGGGSSTNDGDATSGTTLNGIAAVGAPLMNAHISIKGSRGNQVTSTTSDEGTFSADVSGLTAPYILKAFDASRELEFYSYAKTAGNINITPITTIIVSRALETGVSLNSLFANFDELNIADFQTKLTAAIAEMNGLIDFDDFDHFYGVFIANGTEYDGILDAQNFSYHEGSILILDPLDSTLIIATNDIEVLLESNDNPFATLSGRITDGSSNEPIIGALVTAYLTDSEQTYVTNTDENGNFSLNVPRFNTFTIEVSGADYQTTTIENVSTFSAVSDISLSVIPTVPSSETELVAYNATILNAASNENEVVTGANINLRTGINSQNGEALLNSTSDNNGMFGFANLKPGNYTLELTKTGFYQNFENIYVDSTNQSTNHIVSIHPDINEEDSATDSGTDTGTDTGSTENKITSLVITLKWDAKPSDLDAHLTGPKANLNERFHVDLTHPCWADTQLDETASCETEGTQTALLERDDVDGYGPESIAIRQLTNGHYNFYVHHADYFLSTDEGSISGTSNAEVKVIDSNGKTYTFYAPVTGGNGANDIWHVFTTDSNGVPMSVNRIEAHDSDVTGTLE